MKDLRRWIYAGLATFVVGGVLGAIGFGSLESGIAGVVVFTIVYSALQRMGGNRKMAVRDDSARAAALALVPPPAHGIVYVYRSGFMAKLLGIDIAVDGVVQGQLVSPRSMQLILPAGPHQLTTPTSANTMKPAKPLTVDLASGGIAVVEVQIQSGMMKNILKLRLEPDAEAARQRLATMPMIVSS